MDYEAVTFAGKRAQGESKNIPSSGEGEVGTKEEEKKSAHDVSCVIHYPFPWNHESGQSIIDKAVESLLGASLSLRPLSTSLERCLFVLRSRIFLVDKCQLDKASNPLELLLVKFLGVVSIMLHNF